MNLLGYLKKEDFTPVQHAKLITANEASAMLYPGLSWTKTGYHPPPKKKSGNLFKSFPSRYVTGTVEMDVDKFMNWVGDFSDVNAALIFAASGGIPLTSITSGGQIIKVQFEHVWVEAWIDYLPSRGARHKTGKGDTWVSLDASYKKNTPMPLVMAFSFTFHKRSP